MLPIRGREEPPGNSRGAGQEGGARQESQREGAEGHRRSGFLETPPLRPIRAARVSSQFRIQGREIG